MADKKYDLVYFPVRGRGEPIRYMFEDNSLPYKETDAMPFDSNFLKNWKPRLAFGQLPLLKDGDFEIVQSNAILRYLGRKHGLYGSNDVAAARIDELNDGVEDLRCAYTKMIYQNYDNGKADYVKKLPDNLKYFEKLLAASKANETGAAVDGKISFLDYNLFDLLDAHTVLSPGCLDEFPTLKAYHQKMAARPKMAAFRQTESFQKRPINGNGKQ